MISYKVHSPSKNIILTSEVVENFIRNRQMGAFSKERGGQLFAKFEEHQIVIEKATGPRIIDSRKRFSFMPNRKAEQSEINSLFLEGLHYIGDWHTHPQKRPSPSNTDIRSMSECFRKSKHELDFFILIIVGQENPPDGIWLSIHDVHQCKPLAPLTNEDE